MLSLMDTARSKGTMISGLMLLRHYQRAEGGAVPVSAGSFSMRLHNTGPIDGSVSASRQGLVEPADLYQ